MSKSEDEQLAKQSQDDQAQGALTDMARNLSIFFKDLRDNGFSRQEAFELTKQFLTDTLHLGKTK